MTIRQPAPQRPGAAPLTMHRASSLIVALLLGVGAIACVQQTELPEDCNAGSVQRQASLDGDRLDPAQIDVCKGQELTLIIASERAGEIHLHGYEEEAEVEPGHPATITVSTTLPGQFPIELHQPDNGSETEIGILTVHEP